PRIEEVSDSDFDSDPAEADIDDFADSDIMRRVEPKSSTPSSSSAPQQVPAAARQPASIAPGGAAGGTLPASADRSAYADFQCLYPVYFDASRSRTEGRRVSTELAVKDPLAREIANACSRLRLPTLFEPEKVHPKDWANPGRVKVGLKKTPGHPVQNKHHLYRLVADHLRENPTTEDSQGLRVRIGGQLQPEPGKPYPKPAVPRGWKMGELLPYLSAAMTGGGVSENLFKDMMKEMQGGGDPMSALMGAQAGGEESSGGGGGKKKKDKKGKGRA
ncbi:hypothetical protein FALBO_6107, partial [Fusarium albosuccineum]